MGRAGRHLHCGASQPVRSLSLRRFNTREMRAGRGHSLTPYQVARFGHIAVVQIVGKRLCCFQELMIFAR